MQTHIMASIIFDIGLLFSNLYSHYFYEKSHIDNQMEHI